MHSIKILDSILEVWKIKHTKKGLLYILAIWNAILVSSFGLPTWAIHFLSIPLQQETKSIILISAATAFLISNGFVISIWKYFTSIPNYLPSDIGIIFAPHYDIKCNELILGLYKNMKEDFKSLFKDSKIKFRLLPDNFKINSNEEASEILNRSKSYLLIHGVVDKDKLNSENIEGFKQISFTIKNKSRVDLNSNPILKDISHALAFRKFLVKENNAFLELDILKNNLKESSLFFLTLSLMLEGENSQALPFIASLYEKVKNFQSDNPSWNRFKEIVEELVRSHALPA